MAWNNDRNKIQKIAIILYMMNLIDKMDIEIFQVHILQTTRFLQCLKYKLCKRPYDYLDIWTLPVGRMLSSQRLRLIQKQ